MWADRPILLIHNAYTEAGGEDVAFENDVALLERHGHHVERMVTSNAQMVNMGRLRAGTTMIWNADAASAVETRVRECNAGVVHFHNTFPLLSPAVFAAAHRGGAAVVQTLHNYRLVCAAGTLLRDGKPCELCVGRVPWRAAAYGCYRSSRSISGTTALMTQLHRSAGTWDRGVDAFIVLTEFGRQTFIRGGLPPERLHVRPNFLLDDPGPRAAEEPFLLYVGRLMEEKGIGTLLRAVEGAANAPVVIVGDGPMSDDVRAVASAHETVTYLGGQPPSRVIDLMKRARALVVPSICYEGFPMVVAEAFACGLPVIGSDIGALGSILGRAGAGWLVPAGDGDALAMMMRHVMTDEDDRSEKSRIARKAFEAGLSADAAYASLRQIYDHGVTLAARGRLR